MDPVVLLCSEPLRPRMAGIGIRYFEMAKRLPQLGIPVRLVSPFRTEDERRQVEASLGGATTVTYSAGPIAETLEGCRAVVSQGQLTNEVIYQVPEVPLVVDLYDPWLVENLHYYTSMGLDPYRNDHATWMLQLSAGDLFLCSSAEQRLFYAGLLVATGRVNPKQAELDPACDRLLRQVPFGIPVSLPDAEPVLPPRESNEKRILFGGLYDWYDPWPLLEGFAHAVSQGASHWRLLIVHNPNSGTPQTLVQRVRRWVKERGLVDRVQFLDWLPADRRYDLLRDVDVLAATHKDSLETQLSLRTRFLDALAVGCPILVTEGGTISHQLERLGAGWVVPESDSRAVEVALVDILEGDGQERQRRLDAAKRLAGHYSWEAVLDPLVEYLHDPWTDDTKQEFTQRLATVSPDDTLGFRVRRKLSRWSRKWTNRGSSTP